MKNGKNRMKLFIFIKINEILRLNTQIYTRRSLSANDNVPGPISSNDNVSGPISASTFCYGGLVLVCQHGLVELLPVSDGMG
jgi:hypothetical protein